MDRSCLLDWSAESASAPKFSLTFQIESHFSLCVSGSEFLCIFGVSPTDQGQLVWHVLRVFRKTDRLNPGPEFERQIEFNHARSVFDIHGRTQVNSLEFPLLERLIIINALQRRIILPFFSHYPSAKRTGTGHSVIRLPRAPSRTLLSAVFWR